MLARLVYAALLALVLPLTLFSITPTASSQDPPTPLPPCSTDDLAVLRAILPDFAERYRALSDRAVAVTMEGFAQHTPDADAVLRDINQFQMDWWSEGAPALPPCVLAVEAERIVGRLLDETLIALLLMGHYPDLADAHADPIFEYGAALKDLFHDLTAPAA
jgi:hypothetical protein